MMQSENMSRVLYRLVPERRRVRKELLRTSKHAVALRHRRRTKDSILHPRDDEDSISVANSRPNDVAEPDHLSVGDGVLGIKVRLRDPLIEGACVEGRCSLRRLAGGDIA
jgi:hypothetical protein